MKADLHVHSDYSDGSDSVETVFKKAKEYGVTHISFVDHDTVAGYEAISQLGEMYGITAIPGIEISAFDFKRDRKVHILGYDYSPNAYHINSLCSHILEKRQAHSLWQIEQIRQSGIEVDADLIVAGRDTGTTIYKQHIMNVLTDSPYDSIHYQNLYKRLFKGEGVASGDIVYADAFDAVRAIKADGGTAVIAHPGQLDSYDLIPELIEAGLDGIERNHPDHTESDHQKVERLSDQYNLIMTGGSDYHGHYGPPTQIGSHQSPTAELCRNSSKFVGDRYPFY